MKEVSSLKEEVEICEEGEGGRQGGTGAPVTYGNEQGKWSERKERRRDSHPYFSEPSPQIPLILLSILFHQ